MDDFNGLRKIFVGMIEFAYESTFKDMVLDATAETAHDFLECEHCGVVWVAMEDDEKVDACGEVYSKRETIDVEFTSPEVQSATLYLLTDTCSDLMPFRGNEMQLNRFWGEHDVQPPVPRDFVLDLIEGIKPSATTESTTVG
jgi:hypothetical protein